MSGRNETRWGGLGDNETFYSGNARCNILQCIMTPLLFHEAPETLLVVRKVHGRFGRYLLLPNEPVQILLEGRLSFLSALPHHLVNFTDVIILDRGPGR